MECPICRSAAVVAKTCIENYVELLQEGIDPYDLICHGRAEAECRSCGHVFVPGADAHNPGQQP